MQCKRVAALTALAMMTYGAVGRAEPATWLTVDAPPSCSLPSAHLAERVQAALVGERAAEARASVLLEERPHGYVVTLRATRDSQSWGTKIVEAATCAEVTNAVVLVLALALGVPASVEEPSEREAPTTRSVSLAEAPTHLARAPEATRSPGMALRWRSADAPLAEERAKSVEERSQVESEGPRLSLVTGLDHGTLAESTAYLAMGLVVSPPGPVQLRGALRYGLPGLDENEVGGITERSRNEFGALELGVCHEVGTKWRFAGCAGGELSILRESRELRGPAGENVDTDELRARLAGVLSALVAHRGSRIQPEFEVSGVGLALGRQKDAAWAAVRVGAGAALHF